METKTRFKLGHIVITRSAARELPREDVHRALRLHSSGDWGMVCPDDWQANDQALKEGSRVLSAYLSAEGKKFWIITEWDRSATTILFPDEY